MQPHLQNPPAHLAATCLVSLLTAVAPAHASARTNDDGLEPVAADGFQKFMNLMADFAAQKLEELPNAGNSPRENAYGQLAALQLAATASAMLLPAAGLALGGGIGLCIDACVLGADGGVGTVAGGSIGLGGGMIVGGGLFVASLVATLPMVDYIEQKYPPPATASGRSGANFVVTGAGAVAGAGPLESYYVNLVATLPDAFLTVVERWGNTPGLGANEKAWLASVDFARPHLQRLAWIKRNLRVSPNAPRANDLFLDIGQILSGDAAAQERAWLAALGLGSTGLEVKNEKLALDIPPTLQAFGVPARLQVGVPDLKVKVGGNGGALDPYLRFALEAGPFDVDWGKLSVVKSGADKGLLALEYSIDKGARLGSARVYLKAGGNESKIVDLAPKFDSKVGGSLYFRLRGLSLEFVKAKVGSVELRFGLPQEIRDLPIVKDLVNGLLADVEREAKDFLRDTIPFAGLFGGIDKGAVRALAANVKHDAGSHGLARIDTVSKVEVVDGVVKVHVQGKTLAQPTLGKAVEEARKSFEQFASASAPRLPKGKGPVLKPQLGG